jgi:hypothetical protein
MIACLLAVTLLLGTQEGVSAVSVPRTPVSREQASAFAKKLDDLQRLARGRSAVRSVQVTEGEVNSFLNLVLLPTLPGTVRDVEIQVDKGRLAASGIVDIDQVKKLLSLSPWNPVSLLRGRIPVNLSARYEDAREGYGRLTVEDVDADGVSIPVSLLAQLVASSTRSPEYPDGVDIRRAIKLPPPLRGLRLLSGRAFLDL